MTKKTQKQELERDEHMANALAYADQLVAAAELRGLTGYDMTRSIAAVLAARNPTLAGKVLVAVMDAVNLNPITKVITTHEAGGTLQ
jgi:hypothetical protein